MKTETRFINVCSHCGEADAPEDTATWPEDEDGDRICHTCADARNWYGAEFVRTVLPKSEAK